MLRGIATKALALGALIAVVLVLAFPTQAQSLINLAKQVKGTLLVANGGSGVATTTAYSPLFSGTTATGAWKADTGPGTSGYMLASNGAGAYPTWQAVPVSYCIAVSDETTALTTGTAKVTFRMPYAMTLTAVRGSVVTAATGATLLTVDVNEAGTTILSTKLTFDASETTTTTAATAAVISDSALADDAAMTIDIDAVGNTVAGAGLKVCLIGTKT